MCSRPPTPPPLPEARPTAPAPEKTTKAVVSGTQRKKKNQPGSGVKSRGGTSSLQISPLDTGTDPNLNIN